MSTREELVRAVEDAEVVVVAWDAGWDAGWADALNVYTDAKAALIAYDKENT